MAIRLMQFPWPSSGIRRIAGGIVVQWSQWSLYLTWRA